MIYTWGNVSGISDDRRYMVIKPSGVSYNGMGPDDMVVVDVQSGQTVDGKCGNAVMHCEKYAPNFPTVEIMVGMIF